MSPTPSTTESIDPAGEPPPRRTRRLLATIFAIDGVLLAIAILGGLRKGDPSRYFQEAKFLTHLSCAQLAATAACCLRTFARRRASGATGARVWAILALGFVFLALDDAFEVHENLDVWIHGLLGIEETALTDRLDDFLIVVYGAAGAALLWLHRAELFSHAAMLPYLEAGFALMLFAAGFDALGNRPDVVALLDPENADAMVRWVDVIEGTFQILAEATFLTAFSIPARSI